MRLNKRYQNGGKGQPQQPHRDTIQKILRTPMLKNGRRIVQGQVDSDQGAIPMSEYTPEEMEAYEKYSEENFPFVDFDIHEFVADRRAKESVRMIEQNPTLRALADSMNEYGLILPDQQQPAPQPAPQRPAPIGLRRMFPLPPPQNQIIATDQRQLEEMLFDERRKGREAVRVMKADQSMSTGASPDYDVYWDEKRKQWKTRPIDQEEVDRYKKENRIFVTPRISF